MLAICESCGQAQPAGWNPGDLCVHCGQAVRRDVRCFWCVKWTPGSGKFCRSCAAGVVEARLYGAARMLKSAGVDRFGVPKMLAELDPEQIENFTNIYQRHAGAMRRHVDHVAFLETFLQNKSWSNVLEEELIAQLPWPDERLAALSPALDPAEISGPRSRDEGLRLARAIAAITPFPVTRALAALVRLLLDDWEIQREALGVLASGDAQLRGEAAIALTNWRVVYGPGIGDDRNALMEALGACPFKTRAAAQVAMLRESDAELPGETRESSDPEMAFTVALAAGDVDRLVAAERDDDPLKRYAAARRMVRLGNFAGVGEVLRRASAGHSTDLLHLISYKKKAVPELRDVLFELLEAEDREVRKSASFVLLLGCQPGDARRIARAVRGEGAIFQRIFQTAEVPGVDLEAVAELLLDQNLFRADQWGMTQAAAQGRLPASFAARHFVDTADAARVELVKLAEMQLEQYADEDLHRFLIGIAFGGGAQAVRVQAWVSLYRWYKRSDYTGMGPLRIQAAPLERFFGSVGAFVGVLTRFLNDGVVLNELFVREPLGKLLRYSEPDVLPKLGEDPRGTLELAAALRGVMLRPELDLILRLAAIDLLVLIATAPEFRVQVTEILEGFRGTELDHGAGVAIDRIGLFAA